MAKISMIEREKKRAKIAAKFADKRNAGKRRFNYRSYLVTPALVVEEIVAVKRVVRMAFIVSLDYVA